MSSILIKDERKPLGGMTKEQLKNALIENLRGRVVAAYLFGSVATETFDVDSDVDIILVCETKTPLCSTCSRLFRSYRYLSGHGYSCLHRSGI
ncbi:MAG: nucleotidyltransferase domain-containing protein [Oligoflexia bacterium]|nr:nucleotidyltransferase domain-containing protein [Oligoflexia bacterium]